MKRVFLAGATGLLGSVILKKLIEDCEVSEICVLLHKNKLEINSEKARFIEGDVDICSINLAGYDVVYNCVGEKQNEKKMYAVNVGFAIALLEQAIKHNVRVYVYFSSVGSFGAARHSGRISELTPSLPKNYYESTKNIAEERLCDLSTGIKLFILQPSNILPTTDSKSLLLPSLTKILRYGFVPVISGRDGWLNYVSDEHVANIAISLPKYCEADCKYIINTPIKYSSAISILAKSLNVYPIIVNIPSWFSDTIYLFCAYFFKIFKIKFFDVLSRKIYEIDNDVYFESNSQKLLENIGKVNSLQLFNIIGRRNRKK